MLLSSEMSVEGVLMLGQLGAEVLDAIRQATRAPTGVEGTCANRYGGYTGTWENLLSPTEEMGGYPMQKKAQAGQSVRLFRAKCTHQVVLPSEGNGARRDGQQASERIDSTDEGGIR
jgi:hypothetical protein